MPVSRVVDGSMARSMTDPKAVAPQLVENYHRIRDGKPLLNLVDMKRGY